LTDTFADGKPIRLFESGSIMQYLVAKYDREHQISYPPGSREFIEVNELHSACRLLSTLLTSVM